MSELIIPGSTLDVQPRTSVRYKDLKPYVNTDQAYRFLEMIFGQTTGYVGLSLLPSGNVRRSAHGFDTWEDGQCELRDDPVYWNFCTDDWPRWNAYAQVGSTLKTPPAVGSRGKAQDALELVGLFADLDVKPGNGTFATREELDRFLARLPEPTLIVDTGSGGCHPYWLYDRPVKVSDWRQRVELDGWYDYMSSVAAEFGRTVDHVQEYARLMRVPGTVRWPRRGSESHEPAAWQPVQLIKDDGPRYGCAELLELSEPHRLIAERRHVSHRETYKEIRSGQLAWLESVGLGHAAQSLLEDRFNHTQDWKPLLEATGWQLCRDNRGHGGTTDCRYWTRPGKRVEDGHSAMTDFGESDVMYVYTDDPVVTSCLVPTSDRFRKITTKYAFALHFLARGDEAKLLRAIHRGEGRVL